MLDNVLAYSGLLATIWIVLGITYTASQYEGYSHSKQFCSELGALGSPTQKLSSLINNYPLGVLFCSFGWFLTMSISQPIFLTLIGLLIIFHGIGTIVAGYYPMDRDPYTKHPSTACKIHSLAGLVMSISLTIAPTLALFSPYFATSFKIFSVICLLFSIVFMFIFAKAYKNKTNLGTHQRLSYGAQLVWLAGLSLWMAR